MTTDRQLLQHAQQTLTPNEYAAYELHAKDMSQRAIALALGISRSAVQSRLENAKRKLQNKGGEGIPSTKEAA